MQSQLSLTGLTSATGLDGMSTAPLARLSALTLNLKSALCPRACPRRGPALHPAHLPLNPRDPGYQAGRRSGGMVKSPTAVSTTAHLRRNSCWKPFLSIATCPEFTLAECLPSNHALSDLRRVSAWAPPENSPPRPQCRRRSSQGHHRAEGTPSRCSPPKLNSQCIRMLQNQSRTSHLGLLLAARRPITHSTGATANRFPPPLLVRRLRSNAV